MEKNVGPKNNWVKRSLVEKMGSTKSNASKNFGPKSMVEKGPVITEILLIWTNGTRTYTAWTNVTLTVGIC